jgi:hypothetical protein
MTKRKYRNCEFQPIGCADSKITILTRELDRSTIQDRSPFHYFDQKNTGCVKFITPSRGVNNNGLGILSMSNRQDTAGASIGILMDQIISIMAAPTDSSDSKF